MEPSSARNRNRGAGLRLAFAGAALLAMPALALAQGAPREAVPATPLDFSRPEFDTETPRYDVSGADTKAAGTVVAEVGGRNITLGDVGDAVRNLPPTVQALPFSTIYPTVLKQLIEVRAMVAHAEKRGLAKDPVVIRRVRAAADRALTNEVLRHEAETAVTEQMMLDRYDRDYANGPGPDEVRLRVILMPTEQEAAALLAQIVGGADFAKVAHDSSRDASAAGGGDLGFMRRDSLMPEIGAVAFALDPNEVVRHPVRTPAGWFLIKVEERRAGSRPSYASVKADIRNALLRESIAAVGRAALAEVAVHTFDIGGKAGPAVAQSGAN
jgi:peptidyl-prolyl cis-trans isomerase C